MATETIIALVSLWINGLLLAMAITGIEAWKKQLKFSHDYKLAREMLQNAYELRYLIGGVRNQ